MNSWKDDVRDAIASLGGAGTYEEIYAEVAARRDSLPPTWQEIIRRTIQASSSDSAGFRGPEDVFSAVDGIGKGVWGLRGEPAQEASAISENPDSNQGYTQNSTVRKAIEMHAVKMAVDHYQAKGAREVIELGKPFDLLVRLGNVELHVEVKGSTRELKAITVTKNEVSHAMTFGTELFVIDQIHLKTDEDGHVTTFGGVMRIWPKWVPTAESLTPLTYRHELDD